MKVAGIKMTDPWASRALRSNGVETEHVASAPVETVVDMEQVAFEHHGPDKNYRPLLHLTGTLSSILPEEALPYGIDEVTFRRGQGPVVDAFYEFDDEQLAELVSKGYFTEGFEPPSTMAGIPWQLPTTIDALIMAPQSGEDAPVVFVTIHGQTELALDAVSSGYDLAEYFENHLTPEAQARTAQKTAQGVPTRSSEINDFLAGTQLTAPDAAHLREAAERFQELNPQAPGEFPVIRASIFDDLMAEFEQKRAAEEAEAAARPVEYDPDSVEGVYHDRIAPGVEKALALSSAEAEAEPEAGDGAPEQDAAEPGADTADAADTEAPEKDDSVLDLYSRREEEELDVVPVAVNPPVSAEQEWTADTDPLDTAGTEAETGADRTDAGEPAPVPAGESGARTEQRRRTRAHRTREHEQALALDREKSAADSGPELG